jgi:hypothetical protein
MANYMIHKVDVWARPLCYKTLYLASFQPELEDTIDLRDTNDSVSRITLRVRKQAVLSSGLRNVTDLKSVL